MPCELSNPPPDLAVSLRDRLGAKVEGTIGVAASLGRSGGFKRYEVVDRGCEQGPQTWEVSERRHEVTDQITVVDAVQKLAKGGPARLGSRKSSPQVRV
jgi:hypothetical protein